MKTPKLFILLVFLLTILRPALADDDVPPPFTANASGSVSGNYQVPGIMDCANPGGVTETYSFVFAGTISNKNMAGCCGVNNPGGITVIPNLQLNVDTTYQAELKLRVAGEFCTESVSVSPLPTCVEVVAFSSDKRRLFFDSPRPSDVTFNVDVRRSTNAIPLTEWEIKDMTGFASAHPCQKGGNFYLLSADGMSQAIASIINVSQTEPCSFSIVGPDLGCTLANTASGAVLTAGTNEGTVHVALRFDNPSYSKSNYCFVEDFYFDLITGCKSCATSCSDDPLNKSVDFRFDLGPSRQGGANAFLQIKSGSPDPALGTPQFLQCNFIRAELEKITNSAGWLRQVRALDRMVDIVSNSASAYSLYFYTQANLLPGKTNGLYQFTNSPFKTVTVELVGGDTNHVRFTSTAEPAPIDYIWQGNGWSLVTGNGLRNETKTITYNGATRTELRTIKNSQDVIEHQTTETWQIFSYGDRLLSRVIGSGPNALTENRSYDTNGRLQQITRSDGSWDVFTYDSLGRQTGHYSPFLNSTLTTNSSQCRFISSTYDNSVVSGSGDDATLGLYTPRRVVEYVLGQEVSRRFNVVKPGERREIQCLTPNAAWNASDNLVTISYLRPDAVYFGLPWKIVRPAGVVQLFGYTREALPSGSSEVMNKTTIWSGVPNATGDAVTNGTREEIWVNRLQQTELRLATDILSGWVTGQESYAYDERGHLTNTVYLDGTSVSQVYDCCNLLSQVDRDGTVATYGYDALKRLLTITVNGITSSNVYNANGDLLRTVRYGTDGSAITRSSSSYDDAGRLVSGTDALNHTTAYTNYTDAGGQTIRITTYPDLNTRVETYASDGSLLKVTGTAVRALRNDYGVESDGGVQRLFRKEIKLDTNGNDTGEWTKTYTDLAGREYKTVYASAAGAPASLSVYNVQGRLAQQIDPDGVTTLYQYNAKGQLEYTAVDLTRDGQLHKAGTNRVTQTVSDVISNAVSGTVVQRTLVYIWPTDNADSSRLISSQEASVDGRRMWSTVWNNGAGLISQSVTVYAGNGTRYVTNVAPNGAYSVSIYQNGRLSSVVNKDANSFQLSSTSYGYDAHGRQNSVADARNGMTTVYFDDADYVTATLTPAPGPGQSAQLTAQYFDVMGRVWKTTLPDNTSFTNEYFATGELKKTSGSHTYPVAYTYDTRGRIKTMTTWTNYASALGAATTTWNYDGYSGFLTNKTYVDGRGPVYNYTSAGRLQSRTWARSSGGQPLVTTYAYNNAGELAMVVYSDGTTPNVTNTYDRVGQVATTTQGSTVCSYVYNDVGELLSENTTGGPLNGITVMSGYDAFVRRTSFSVNTQPSAINVSYGYDKASRLQSVISGANVATYGYVPNSSLVGSVTFWQNGTVRLDTRKHYDFLNRITSISNTPSAAGESPMVFNYQYNDANQRVALTNTDNSRWIYQYDTFGQIVSGKKYWSDGTPVAGQQFEYGFDDIGNRNSTRAGGDQSGGNLRTASYSVNNLNQYTSRTVPGAVDILGSATNTATVTVNGQTTYRKGEYYRDELDLDNTNAAVYASVTNLAVLITGTNTVSVTNTGNGFLPQTPEYFAYDADGNLTNDGRWTYTWDAENRLISMVSLSSAPTASRRKLDFTYDYRGRRTQKVVSTWNGSSYVAQSTNRFVYDGWNLFAEIGASGSLIRSYVWGLDLSGTMQGAGGVGGLLFLTDQSTLNPQPSSFFYSFDGIGNVLGLISANDGTTAAQYNYGPFGELLRSDGALAKWNPSRFSTKFQDADSDLLYYGHRYYNPSMGRWLSRDPVEEAGGLNVYGLVDNDPVDELDVLGFGALYEELAGKKAFDKTWSLKALVDKFAPADSPAALKDAVGQILDAFAPASLRVRTDSYAFGPADNPTCACVDVEVTPSGDLTKTKNAIGKLINKGLGKVKLPSLEVKNYVGSLKTSGTLKIQDCKSSAKPETSGRIEFSAWVGYRYDLKEMENEILNKVTVASIRDGAGLTLTLKGPAYTEINNFVQLKLTGDAHFKTGVRETFIGKPPKEQVAFERKWYGSVQIYPSLSFSE